MAANAIFSEKYRWFAQPRQTQRVIMIWNVVSCFFANNKQFLYRGPFFFHSKTHGISLQSEHNYVHNVNINKNIWEQLYTDWRCFLWNAKASWKVRYVYISWRYEQRVIDISLKWWSFNQKWFRRVLL